jgi:iron uptake system EfeUOB component EfeO/EfeM
VAVYVLAEAAWLKMADKRTELSGKIGKVVKSPGGLRYVLTAAAAITEYKEFVKGLVGDGAFIEAHDGRTISVKCGDCGALQTVYAKVRRYYCRCTPRRERFTFQDVTTGE